MKLDQVWRGALACALALVAIAAQAARADEPFSPAQKSAIDQAIHDYLLAHPEAVLDALKSAQEKSDQAAATEARGAAGVEGAVAPGENRTTGLPGAGAAGS